MDRRWYTTTWQASENFADQHGFLLLRDPSREAVVWEWVLGLGC